MWEGGFPSDGRRDDLTALRAALDGVAEVPLACLPVTELADRACELQHLSARLDAIRAATMAAIESAAEGPAVLRELGFRTAPQMVAARTGAKVDDVRPVAKAGSWLVDFPIFARAFGDGTLTLRHVRDLKALDKPRTRQGLLEAQGYLVELARDGDYRTFSQGLTYWLNAADPNGDEPREQVAKTGCTLTRHSDGSVSGKFHLDPLSAAAMGTALEDEAQRIFTQQSEATGTADTPRQRRGQALVALMIKGAGVPGSATTTPLVNLVMGWELYQNLIERLDDPSIKPVEVDVNDPNRRCELIDGTPIHPNLALMAMAVAEFKRIVIDAKSRAIDVSVKSRCFLPWMKEVLLVEGRGRCRSPGCDSPLAWLQADHIQPHSKGGETILANGQLLCDPHNKWKRDFPQSEAA
jgi:hypothetical protein